MLDIKYIKQNKEYVQKIAADKNIEVNIDKLLHLYENYRLAKQKYEFFQRDCKQSNLNCVSNFKKEKFFLKKEYKETFEQYHKYLLKVPNIVSEDTPVGNDDNSNVEVSSYGTPREMAHAKSHLELGKLHDIIDFESGVKVAQSKFYFLKGDAVLLEMALINFVLQKAIKNGFLPVKTPEMALNTVIEGAGYSPKGKESNAYNIEESDLSLIATSEITLGGMLSEEVYSISTLPKKFLGISSCFRPEAGASGLKSKGLFRVHQFTKLELYQLCTPEDSFFALKEILAFQESIFKDLDLPYRVVRVCSGDLGLAAYEKYDIEAWMPFLNNYAEVTSASNCTDFQARRLNIKFVGPKNKGYAHTINGTALASTRVLLAIIENYQDVNGNIFIPDVLKQYLGKNKIEI